MKRQCSSLVAPLLTNFWRQTIILAPKSSACVRNRNCLLLTRATTNTFVTSRRLAPKIANGCAIDTLMVERRRFWRQMQLKLRSAVRIPRQLRNTIRLRQQPPAYVNETVNDTQRMHGDYATAKQKTSMSFNSLSVRFQSAFIPLSGRIKANQADATFTSDCINLYGDSFSKHSLPDMFWRQKCARQGN